jgi:prephenate dehydratase
VREVERVERRCRYALLGVEGASLEEVTAVLSHPEAFADCAARLTGLVPRAEWRRTPSTGAAARRVAAEGSRAQAAIAPALAAEIYALTVLAAGLEDDPNNRTTWAIIAPAEDG